jgi:hypothetical protein
MTRRAGSASPSRTPRPRTEALICDTKDFGIGRQLNQANWRDLRAVGEAAKAGDPEGAVDRPGRPTPLRSTANNAVRQARQSLYEYGQLEGAVRAPFSTSSLNFLWLSGTSLAA